MQQFTQPKLAFIGGGNMASAIIDGLVSNGYDKSKILVSAPTKQTRLKVVNQFGVNVAEKNAHAAHFADIIILAVKPNLIAEVSRELAFELKSLGRKSTIVSIAASTGLKELETHFADWPVILAMPNLPSSVGYGLTGMVANRHVGGDQKFAIQWVFENAGQVVWLDDESQMPAIVATAGSAPAYFLLFLEAMRDKGMKLGLSEQVAEQAALQSGLGACVMAAKSSENFETLRERVTSPKGTTEQAIHSFQSNQLSDIVAQAMEAAAAKAAV